MRWGFYAFLFFLGGGRILFVDDRYAKRREEGNGGQREGYIGPVRRSGREDVCARAALGCRGRRVQCERYVPYGFEAVDAVHARSSGAKNGA